MKRLLSVITLVIFLLSCGNNDSSSNSKDTENPGNSSSVTQDTKKYKEVLVTSIPPLKWLVQKIAGNDFEIISIIQPNMNHELFDPKPDDLKTLEKSKLFFTYNALNFEKEISDTVTDKKKLVNLLENIDKSSLLENHDDHGHDDKKDNHKDNHDHGDFNPHLWFSLDLMPEFAESVKNKLIQTYPDKKDIFERNYAMFIEELNIFKKEINEKMSSKTKKYFMIYHPVLGYFIKDYPIKEIAVEYQGKEPSAKQIKEIIEEAKEHSITTILVQPQFPKQSIEAISMEIPEANIAEFNSDQENVFENLKKFVDSLE